MPIWFPVVRLQTTLSSCDHGAMSATDPLRALLDAAIEGDDRAVRELVRVTQPVVWRLCSAMGSAGEEDDLVQETFLQVFRSGGSFRGDSPVQSWVLAIARNVCADHVRRRVRQRRLVERLTTASTTAEAAADTGLEQYVQLLSDERREAFVLTQVVGLPYDEAARVIGCPIGTVRSRVARARADLVEALRLSDAV
jgi:RNA polymerase sigma-70 factor, ECF subfamily